MRASDKKTTPWNLPVREFTAWKRRMEEERLANDPNLTPEEVASRLSKVAPRAAGDDLALGILDVLDRPANSIAGGIPRSADMGSSDAMSDVERKAHGENRYLRDRFGPRMYEDSDGNKRMVPSQEEVEGNLDWYFEELPPPHPFLGPLTPIKGFNDRKGDAKNQVASQRTGVDLAGEGGPRDSVTGELLPPPPAPLSPEEDPTLGYAKGYRLSKYQLHEDTTPIGRPVPDNGTVYLYADRDIAQQQYQNALQRLGIKQQLADVVRWSKSKSSSTRKDPRAALGAIAGLSESADKFDAGAQEEFNKKLAAIAKQKKEDEQRTVQVGEDIFYVPVGTDKELETLRTVAKQSVGLEDIAKKADALDPLDPRYKSMLHTYRQQAMHIISKAGEQGAISKDELEQYNQMLPIGESDRAYSVMVPNLKKLATVFTDRARSYVRMHQGKKVGGK